VAIYAIRQALQEKCGRDDYGPDLTFRRKSGKQMANTLFLCIAKINVSA
jgi:hypothetical protein